MSPLRPPALPIAAVLAAFVALRLLQASCLTEADALDFEDGYAMAAAWETVHRPVWPYAAYQYEDYEGGSRVMVWLAIPFMAALGPSLFALKLAALTVTLVTAVGVGLVAFRQAGTAGALGAALLFALAPDPLLTYGLVAKGSHAESAALQMMFVWGLAGVVAGRGGRVSLFALGLLAGLGISFAYVFAVTLAAALLSWPWRVRALNPGERVAAVGGLALGLLPLVLYLSGNGAAAASIDGRSAFGFGAGELSVIDRLAAFVRVSLPTLLHFPHFGRECSTWDHVYVATFWTLAAAGFWTAWRVRADGGSGDAATGFIRRLTLVYTAGYLALAALGGHELWAYHLVPLLAIHLPGVAAHLVALIRARRAVPVWVTAVCMALLLGAGLRANLAMLSRARLGVALALDARDYLQFFTRARIVDQTRPLRDYEGRAVLDRVLPALEPDARLRALMFRSAPARWLHDLEPAAIARDAAFARGYVLGATRGASRPPSDGPLTAALAPLDAAQREHALAGYGFSLAGQEPDGRALARLTHLPAAWQPSAAFGAGRALFLSEVERTDGRVFTQHAPDGLAPVIARGLGYELGRRSLRRVPDRIDRIVPEPLRGAFREGLDLGIAKRAGADAARPATLIR